MLSEFVVPFAIKVRITDIASLENRHKKTVDWFRHFECRLKTALTKKEIFVHFTLTGMKRAKENI